MLVAFSAHAQLVLGWLVLVLPLAGAVLITALPLLARLFDVGEPSRRAAGWISTLSVAGAFVFAVAAFAGMLTESPSHRTHGGTIWRWLTAGSLDFGLGIRIDPLSIFMMLIVTGVGALIVGYSIGYMDGDDEERRFFAYMALFVFSMLLLVESGNLLMLLAGWGLVGLSSYLLIGYNQDRPAAIAAAKKAFIVNAFGDATFALALFLIIKYTSSLDYGTVFARWPAMASNHWVVNLVALGLLGGAVAKSAQLPLQTWLPDAMEGPTPVSALIHAATMVTAGVYLIVRLHPLFEIAPKVQDLAAGLGAATLVMAGLIALVQTDIKRVIAYSTMSQIGYMFLGAGLGAYANGMFHLLTHAFFKALLFLAAGIVIHALAGEQDIRNMGGLRKLMPLTYVAFIVGGLSLVGVPPFAGFFSKDSILASALAHGWYGDLLFAAGEFGALLTGLYTFRMIFIVFGGKPSEYVQHHPPHRTEQAVPRLAMGIAVGALAALSLVGGWLQFAPVWHPVTTFLDPVARPLVEASGWQETLATVLAVVLGVAGIAGAWAIYSAGRLKAPRTLKVLQKKFYFDELYDLVFYRTAVGLARGFAAVIEGPLIGGSMTGVAETTRFLGLRVRAGQTGLVRTYVFVLAAGLAVLLVLFVAVR